MFYFSGPQICIHLMGEEHRTKNTNAEIMDYNHSVFKKLTRKQKVVILMTSAKKDLMMQYAIKYIEDGNDLNDVTNEKIRKALHTTCEMQPRIPWYKDIKKLINTRDEWYKKNCAK